MSTVNINLAFQKRLALLTPALATAYNVEAYEPITNVPYQRVKLFPAKPENPTMGDAYRREVGFYQIALYYPLGNQTVLASPRAELTANHFKRGTSMTEAGQTILVTQTPTISPASVIENRYVIFVTIFYRSEIFV